jgi:hypothetical protein
MDFHQVTLPDSAATGRQRDADPHVY